MDFTFTKRQYICKNVLVIKIKKLFGWLPTKREKMREKTILTKDYLNKEKVLFKIEELGEKYHYVIEKSETYANADIDFYTDNNYDYLISFRFILEENFNRDPELINGENYYFYIVITHDSDLLSKLNIILKDILSEYPEMYVTDEMYKDFYNIDDINSGNVDDWLKV